MGQKPKILVVIRSLLFSYVLTGIFLAALAFFLYKMKLGERQVALGVNAIYIITCFLGGFMIGKSMGQRKFLWGFVLGAAYFAVLLLVTLVLNQGFNREMQSIVTVLVMCLASGTAGGMLS